MKTIIKSLTVISLLALCLSCSDNDETGQILLTVTGECYADIRLFAADGRQLDYKNYDCQETRQIIFTVKEFGLLLFHAETAAGKSLKKTVQIFPGKVIEKSIDFK